MGNKFAELAFTKRVKAEQERGGSRRSYARFEGGEESHDQLGPRESTFIGARDSFYISIVGETGWPYIQHRGGPVGFVHVLRSTTIGFADFKGNRQYISVGNLSGDNRVSLFFMDYPNQIRLKLFGHARVVTEDETTTLKSLTVPGYEARVERGFLIQVEACDWNCTKHITRRFTPEEFMASSTQTRSNVH